MSKEIILCNKSFPCPCCGYMSFKKKPGSHDHCHICMWQDDEIQLRSDWWNRGGANLPLRVAQENYAHFGSKETRLIDYCRTPVEGDLRDPVWYPLPEATEEERNAAPVSGSDYFHAYEDERDEQPYYWRRASKADQVAQSE